jgi:NitT/TauT family transport system permease protein
MGTKFKSLAPLGVVAGLIGVWWLGVELSQSMIFPTPLQVVVSSIELVRQGILIKHISASLFRVTFAYLLAALCAIPLGVLMGWFKGVHAALNPLVQLLRPISPIAWIPIAILWFGVGEISPIFLIFLSSFFPMVVETTSGVHAIERQYIRAAQNFGVSGLKLFRLVIFPAALPQIITGMRISLGVAWLVVVAAEMIALNSGLGYLIIDSRNAGNRYDLVVAGMMIIGIIGFFLDGFMRRLEDLKEIRWRYGR